MFIIIENVINSLGVVEGKDTGTSLWQCGVVDEILSLLIVLITRMKDTAFIRKVVFGDDGIFFLDFP